MGAHPPRADTGEPGASLHRLPHGRAALCGGQDLYIPKLESLERSGRDREIRARFDGGNYRALSVQFRLSERQIRKIINGTRS